MTPSELIAWARTQTGSTHQQHDELTEGLLSEIAVEALNGSSLGFLRARFFAGAATGKLKLDDGTPLDVTEHPVNLDKPTVR